MVNGGSGDWLSGPQRVSHSWKRITTIVAITGSTQRGMRRVRIFTGNVLTISGWFAPPPRPAVSTEVMALPPFPHALGGYAFGLRWIQSR